MKLKANNYTQAELLRMIRDGVDETQKQMAMKLHRHERTIQKYELGERSYDVSTLLEIANIYDLEIIIQDKKPKP